MWLIYAALAAIITGVGQVLVKKGQIEITPILDNLIATIIVNIILVPILFIYGVDTTVSKEILIYALIVATMYATFYYIINAGNVSVMISLINTFPIVTIALAINLLHEWPNKYQWVGIILVIFGTIYISQEKEKKTAKRKIKSWVILGLVGSLAIGIAEFITKLATLKTDAYTFTFYLYMMYIPTLIIFTLFDKAGRKFEKLKNTLSLAHTIIGIFFIELGLLAIALAYQHGPASLVSPIVASHMLITSLLAIIFLKEKIITIQKIGIILTTFGVIIIGIWS